jgi:hypothetical protein
MTLDSENPSGEAPARKPTTIEQLLTFLDLSKFITQDDRDRDFSDEVQEEF